MIALPPRKPPKLGVRADFKPEEFRKIIFTDGLTLIWEMAQECPCARRTAATVTLGNMVDATGGEGHTAEPRMDCVVCGGRGYFHHSAQEIVGIVTDARSDPRRFEVWGGENALGMVSISLLPENLPGFLDRFTMKNSVQLFREVRTRTADVVEALRYPVVPRVLDLQGGEQTIAVLHAYKAGADGVAPADGLLTVGVDFDVTVDGKIDWTKGIANGKAPVEGGRYAMAYYAHPRWVVVNHPHAIRDTNVGFKKSAPEHQPLPVQAVCKLEFLV